MHINEVRLDECPVTAIDAEAEAILNLVLGSKMAHEATGACLYGTNLSEYPAWLYDAVLVVEAADRAATRATTE